jgi:ascorbate PTS system EIIA or EIIAB component
MAGAGPLGGVTTTVTAQVGLRADGWRDAIHSACRPLVTSGAVHPRYADACVGVVEEHGPYIVLAPGIALAHAHPEDGVVRTCLAAAVLADPVAFGHETNDPVDVVFVFGSPDREQHVGLLAALSRALLAGLADVLRGADEVGARHRLQEVADDIH